jgi:FAD/FMN-containing dehydrogenase
MISRRVFIAGSAALVASQRATEKSAPKARSTVVNDVHSQLNSTHVLEIVEPRSLADVQRIVHTARKDRKPISVAGGRHAMGGQQFGTDTVLIDIRRLNRVLRLDPQRGILEIEAGIEWPQLIDGYLALQKGRPRLGVSPRSKRVLTD